MLKRSLVAVALACGCSPAVLPDLGALPSTPSAASRAHASEGATLVAARSPHARHVARLAPPFAGSNLTRRVPDSEPMTALAGNP